MRLYDLQIIRSAPPEVTDRRSDRPLWHRTHTSLPPWRKGMKPALFFLGPFSQANFCLFLGVGWSSNEVDLLLECGSCRGRSSNVNTWHNLRKMTQAFELFWEEPLVDVTQQSLKSKFRTGYHWGIDCNIFSWCPQTSGCSPGPSHCSSAWLSCQVYELHLVYSYKEIFVEFLLQISPCNDGVGW